MPTAALPHAASAAPDTHAASTAGRRRAALGMLVALWAVLFVVSLFTPPVLDDADGTHANAARQMALSGDWVTLRVNNVRYLEKAPLPYWITAVSLRLFGINAFAAHLPEALGVLALALLGFRWAREAFGERAALYTGLATLTSAGVFLFTRIFIPDLLLSLLLAVGLYCFLHALEAGEAPPRARLYPYAMWAALGLAVLTKGLVALVFLIGTAALYLALTGEYRWWRRLRPVSGMLLMLAVVAPWHILAGLRNTGGLNGHGFFWFYFINEHVLRFLGRRIPRDYNKLPGYLYWTLHLVWLFPWALFLPLAVRVGWAQWRQRRNSLRHAIKMGRIKEPRPSSPYGVGYKIRRSWKMFTGAMQHSTNSAGPRTTLLLTLFSGFVLFFFSVSTNQEYYTFPAYLPILMLTTAALARIEKLSANGETVGPNPYSLTPVFFAHGAFTVIGLAVAGALAYGLWISRHIPFVPDIGDLLAHRGVGDYTLSMSALFDLTGPSFAALRWPAALAMAAFAMGPAAAWMLRQRRRHFASTLTIGLTSATFLIAAHIALVRFAPMLSSQDFAEKIQELEDDGAIARNSTLLLYGDQAYGSSIPFYLNRPLSQPALLVEGRSSSMLFGSTFPDAQGLFLTAPELLAQWGTGPRKLLFVPIEERDPIDRLLGTRPIVLAETSGKVLLTDRPLDRGATPLSARVRR